MEKGNKTEISSNSSLPLESAKLQVISIVRTILSEKYPTTISGLMETFVAQFDALLKRYETEESSDLLRYYRITTQYESVLSKLLDPGEDFNELCSHIDKEIESTLNKSLSQNPETESKKMPIRELKYYCTVCKQSFTIPSDMKNKIENSDETIKLPSHHGKEMTLKIESNDPCLSKTLSEKFSTHSQKFRPKLNTPHEPSSKQKKTKNQEVNALQVLSVGIDVGSSTSHLIFSRLTLKREYSFINTTNRFKVVDRKIVYEGEIIFTPLLDKSTIDTEKLIEFFKKEYEKANITPEMIDTGAVIVTGETAKKDNAAEIVKRLSSEAGKFVCASAGPNFESMLGIMGSGMAKESKRLHQTIMNVDIGGGTSNIAIALNGNVISTSCINVGGRLLGIDKDFKIWRIDEPTELVMQELGLNYKLGDIISEEDVSKIAKAYANALFEVMKGPAKTSIAKLLMMTENIDFSIPVQRYSFSGGVAEMIYNADKKLEKDNSTSNLNPYNDIGQYLANEIKILIEKHKLPLIEPKNKIRATVIGAGAFSLTVSGSTCYWDGTVNLPLNNIPIVPIELDYNKFYFDGYQEYVKQKIDLALRNFNLVEGEDVYALYFKEHINRPAIVPFSESIEYSFPNSIIKNKPILIILGEDGGKMFGLTIKRITSIKKNLLCLDELNLEAGDWVDIGAPLNTGAKKAFPITKKSLVFNNK
ncbi:MAG: ethanolamine ammonia-lyase reactivating factor EutA [Promethearchaeota archaeon]